MLSETWRQQRRGLESASERMTLAVLVRTGEWCPVTGDQRLRARASVRHSHHIHLRFGFRLDDDNSRHHELECNVWVTAGPSIKSESV